MQAQTFFALKFQIHKLTHVTSDAWNLEFIIRIIKEIRETST